MFSKPDRQGTLSCVLCGGTHVYPGPRFLNHLINTHGVLQNLEYIIRASQYKDTYSRLPPLITESSKPSKNQTTQTKETLPPPHQCTRCYPPADTFLTSTSIRQNSHQKSSQFMIAPVQSPGTYLSATARSHSVISQIRNKQSKKVDSSEGKQEISCQAAANITATETAEVSGSETGDMPARSGFRCVCSLCNWVTTDDTTFWSHITRKHQMNYKLYKTKHGLCQVPTGNGMFQCVICNATMKHMPGLVDKHLRARHQVSWTQYLDWVKEDRIKSCQKKIEYYGPELKTGLSSVGEAVVESQPLTPSKQSVKNSRPMNIRDKTNKNCTQCKISFQTRNLFLVHCQLVHKLRFKSKAGGSLSFQQSGSSAAVAFNMSAHHFPNSTPTSQSLDLSVPRDLQRYISSQPGKVSSSLLSVKKVTCRYCQKIFASVCYRDRHVRLHCKGAAGDGLEVNEVQDDQPIEGVGVEVEGFKCHKCGRLFSKLGNLNRHFLNTCYKLTNQ